MPREEAEHARGRVPGSERVGDQGVDVGAHPHGLARAVFGPEQPLEKVRDVPGILLQVVFVGDEVRCGRQGSDTTRLPVHMPAGAAVVVEVS